MICEVYVCMTSDKIIFGYHFQTLWIYSCWNPFHMKQHLFVKIIVEILCRGLTFQAHIFVFHFRRQYNNPNLILLLRDRVDRKTSCHHYVKYTPQCVTSREISTMLSAQVRNSRDNKHGRILPFCFILYKFSTSQCFFNKGLIQISIHAEKFSSIWSDAENINNLLLYNRDWDSAMAGGLITSKLINYCWQ